MADKKEPLLTGPEKVLVDLTLEKREPKTGYEEELLKDIEKIKQDGKIVEIPGEWF